MRLVFAACIALVAGIAWSQEVTSFSAGTGGEGQEYNLRLELAAPEVDVTVLDPHGRVVFQLRDAGPLLLVDLPRGVYFVRADNGGVVRVRTVVVGEHSGMSAAFAWPA